MFSITRFCLRVLADLNEIIRRMKRNVILTIAIITFLHNVSKPADINPRDCAQLGAILYLFAPIKKRLLNCFWNLLIFI
jgi:hypothetical protein